MFICVTGESGQKDWALCIQCTNSSDGLKQTCAHTRMCMHTSARRHLTIHWATPSRPRDPARVRALIASARSAVYPPSLIQETCRSSPCLALPGLTPCPVTSDVHWGSGSLLGAPAPVPHPTPVGLRACPSLQHTLPRVLPCFPLSCSSCPNLFYHWVQTWRRNGPSPVLRTFSCNLMTYTSSHSSELRVSKSNSRLTPPPSLLSALPPQVGATSL